MKKILLCLSLISLNAFAGMTVQEYQNFKDKDALSWYIVGLGNGFAFSNTKLESLKQKRLYCLPNNYKISTSELQGLLSESITEFDSKEVLNLQIEPMLLRKLIDTYPCKRSIQ